MKRKYTLGTSPLCLISAILWGISFPMQDMAAQSSHLIDAFGFNGVRFILGAITLVPLILIFERKGDYSKKRVFDTILYGSLAGAVLFLASIFQQIGIEKTGESGKAGFITSMYLVFVPILMMLIFKQKCSRLMIGAILISIAGLYFLSVPKGSFSVSAGDLLVLVSAVLFAVHFIALDIGSGKASPLLFSAVQFFVTGFLGVICALLFGKITTQGIESAALPILFCGVFSCGAAYTLQFLGQRGASPTACALFCSMEALFAVVFECIIERKIPTTRVCIGCALMLSAVIVSQIPPRKKQNFS